MAAAAEGPEVSDHTGLLRERRFPRPTMSQRTAVGGYGRPLQYQGSDTLEPLR
jgi:hypothetical protein